MKRRSTRAPACDRDRERRERRERRDRGQAMFVAIIFVGLVLTLTLTLSQVASNNYTRVAGNRQSELLLNAARAGLAQSRHELWTAYVESNGGTAGNAASFKAWLDGRGVTGGTPGPTVALSPLTVAPSVIGGLITSVTVERSAVRHDENGTSTFLFISAIARDPAGETRRAEEVLRMGGQPYEGFRFALLANNVNCIFCHARFDNVSRFYGPKDGSHQRVKVASLETLMLRNGPDSQIAGTLYVQGQLMTNSGGLLAVPPGGAGKLQAHDIDAQGKIVDPTAIVDFVTSDNTEQFGNFYKNYPTNPADQLDGPLPAKFPPVVTDTDGDRTIDEGEWSDRVASMAGTLSGGGITAVPAGSVLPGTGLPAGGNTSTYTSNTADTHTVLVGTADDPIVIDGDVAIDGDVVISGYVKGTGLLLARGNMYVVGDIIYADGTDADGKRTFGVAADGTQNTMAFAAGGNILQGNYNVDKSGNLINETSGGFIINELSLFNRMEWTKTQPFYDAATGRPTTTDTGVPNSAYVPDYVPRYYTLDGSATQAQMFLADNEWDNTNKVWVGKEHGDSYTAIPLTGTPGQDYVLRPLNPENNWITQAGLKTIYDTQDAARPDKPYEIDGLLYTDNAIMMLARKSTSSGGQAIVNGAIVSADAGILVPGGAANSGPDEWNEGSKKNGTFMFNEADYLFDVNGDGDISDSVSMATIYANRATWPLNSAVKWGDGTGHIKLASGKYQLDINMDSDYADKVTQPDPNSLGGVGLQLNYDVRTRNFLVIEDPTSVQLFTVSRRER